MFREEGETCHDVHLLLVRINTGFFRNGMGRNVGSMLKVVQSICEREQEH